MRKSMNAASLSRELEPPGPDLMVLPASSRRTGTGPALVALTSASSAPRSVDSSQLRCWQGRLGVNSTYAVTSAARPVSPQLLTIGCAVPNGREGPLPVAGSRIEVRPRSLSADALVAIRKWRLGRVSAHLTRRQPTIRRGAQESEGAMLEWRPSA
jgi:hypothetical protein